MKKLFKKINSLNAQIAESEKDIAAIEGWPNKNWDDKAELEHEKERLARLKAKRIERLCELQEIITNEIGYAKAS